MHRQATNSGASEESSHPRQKITWGPARSDTRCAVSPNEENSTAARTRETASGHVFEFIVRVVPSTVEEGSHVNLLLLLIARIPKVSFRWSLLNLLRSHHWGLHPQGDARRFLRKAPKRCDTPGCGIAPFRGSWQMNALY